MKHLNFPVVVLFAAASVLSACESIVAVPAGVYEPTSSYSIRTQSIWTSYPVNTRTKIRILTVDGTLLNQLVFAESITDGQTVIETAIGDREKLVPKFRSDMTESEVVEFVADSLSVSGMVNISVDNLHPDNFGTLDGVRFEFSGARASGLKISGIAKAAIDDDALHLMLYYGPSEYYYGVHIQEVQEIFDSVELL